MRVILDANVFLSYLVAPDESYTVVEVVEACFQDPTITVIAPQELLTEIVKKATGKPYFQENVPKGRVDKLLQTLSVIAEIPAPVQEEFQSFTRDYKDDYLVAYGLVWDVDYLVTGDKDLLILKQVQTLKMMTPTQFLALLQRR